MDPLAFAVLCGIGSGTVGFLFGGSVFNVIWNIVFKNRSKELQQVWHAYAAIMLELLQARYIITFLYAPSRMEMNFQPSVGVIAVSCC
jgi:hypothetical protein